MNFEWNALNAIVFFSWFTTSSAAGLPVVVIAGLVLFSNSIATNLLLLLTLTLVSFVTTARAAHRKSSAITQKFYLIRLMGILIALLGSITYPPLMMWGLLLGLPIFLWSVLFDRHFESMNLRAYLYSTAVPALVTLVVLERIKPVVTAEFSQLWDISFAVIGITSLILGSVLAFLKKKTKSMLISFTQAWIGLGVFLLMIDSETTKLALTALFCFTLTAPLLLVAGKQYGERAETFGRVLLLGLPGFLSFSTLYYSLKSISTLNDHWVWILLSALIFQTLAMMANGREPVMSTQGELPKKVWFRFGMIVVVQLVCSGGIYYFEMMGGL